MHVWRGERHYWLSVGRQAGRQRMAMDRSRCCMRIYKCEDRDERGAVLHDAKCREIAHEL